jgi:hypothetical protein
MKRAAEELIRTKNVWRQHLAAHRGEVACVCERQVGRFRKGQRVGGCGSPRCWVCHSEKLGGVPTLQQLRSLATLAEGLVEMSSLSNIALERSKSQPRCAQLGAAQRER